MDRGSSSACDPSPFIRPRHPLSLPPQAKIMSLPRADYDPRRVCVNPCPNFTLGHKRPLGVYLAGALVRTFRSHHPYPIRKWTLNPKLIALLSLVLSYFMLFG